MHTPIILAFISYFSFLLIAGLVLHKKQVSSTDYIMGNRSLNFWLVALSAHASDMSAWLFMAYPASIFILGGAQGWTALGLLGGMFLNWHFVAPKLRTMTETYNCCTLSSFFEKRFNDHSGKIRILSALVMIIFLTYYLSAGLIAMGNLLESLFGLDYFLGISIALLVMMIYTFFGGFNTVAWVDLLQGVFLLISILVVPYFAFQKLESWDIILTTASQKHISISPFTVNSFDDYFGLITIALTWGLGYFGMPHIITKFMGIKNPSEMYKSKWIGMTWQLLALGGAFCVGLIAIGYFPDAEQKPQLIFIDMVKDLFSPYLAGLILCAVIAANLSTMDSQILVCGSMIGEDLYLPLHRTAPSDRKVLWFSKFGVVFISLTALLLSYNRSATIMDTVLYAWSGLGSAFGPLVLMSLYSNKVNAKGALAGICVGAISVMIWPTLNPYIMSYIIPPMIPGFTLSLMSIYLVSKWTK